MINRQVQSTFLMALASSFMMAGYECVRSASNSLFKEVYGVEGLPYMIGLTPLMILLCLYGYGKLLDRFSAQRTLLITTALSGLGLASSFAAIRLNWDPARAILFLIREVYAVLLIEQYWSFVNSVISQEQAKRYNGWILAISSIGSVSGAYFVHLFVEKLGTQSLVLIAALACLPSLFLSYRAYQHAGLKNLTQSKHPTKDNQDPLHLGLFRSHPLLIGILALILTSQFYSAFMGLHFQSTLSREFVDMDQQTAFSGMFFAIANGVSLFIQIFVARFVLRRVSPMHIHRLIPLVHLGFALVALAYPGLWSVSAAFLAFKAIDYSLFRASKEILYIPFSFDVRFRAKEIIDVFGYRLGKGFASLLLIAVRGLSASSHILLAITSATTWLLITVPIIRQDRQAGEKAAS